MVSNVIKLCLNIIVAVNIQTSLSCPRDVIPTQTTNSTPSLRESVVDAKAVYKSGLSKLSDMSVPITLDKIKATLKDMKIFNPDDKNLTYRDKKELAKLFQAVEIMTTSRNRQPANVQTLFSSLRLVERAVKKQLKEGQISESLAAKFDWERLQPSRQKRERPSFTVDEKTKMRIFNVTS